MSQDKIWKAVDLDPEVSSQLEEVDLDGEKTFMPNRVPRAEWRTEPYENESRSTLVVFCMYLMVGLSIAYLAAGWEHVKSIDDVIKLLAPVQLLVTTLLGAVIGYFLYNAKNPV